MSFTCTATWETWDPSQCVWHHQIPPVWLFTRHSSSNGSRVRAWPSFDTFHAYRHVADTCTDTWETWNPSQCVWHHQIPPVWLFTCLSSSNGSRVRAWPSFDTLHVYRHVADKCHVYPHVVDTCTDTWETWDPSQWVRHPKIPRLRLLQFFNTSLCCRDMTEDDLSIFWVSSWTWHGKLEGYAFYGFSIRAFVAEIWRKTTSPFFSA